MGVYVCACVCMGVSNPHNAHTSFITNCCLLSLSGLPTAQHLVSSFSAATRGRNPSKFEVGASDTSPPPAAPSGRPPGVQREEKPRRIHLMAATYLETIGARLLDLTGRSGMFWLPFTHGSTWVYLHTARILYSPTHPTTTLATRLALVLLLLKGCYISARAHTQTRLHAHTYRPRRWTVPVEVPLSLFPFFLFPPSAHNVEEISNLNFLEGSKYPAASRYANSGARGNFFLSFL